MTHLNLTCGAFESQLPDYLEGTLSDSAAADAELHLAACAACRSLVHDLREISRQAAALPALVPSRDLWPEIEGRIQARVVAFTPRLDAPAQWSVRRLSAIAAALVGITAISTYTLATRDRTPPDAGVVANQVPGVSGGDSSARSATPASTAPVAPELGRVPASPSSPDVTPVSSGTRAPRPEAGVTYATEISRLRGVISDRSNELDPTTVAILESSVATIDSAIAEARAALARDPASRFLNQQLNKSLERKLGLLKKAALLTPST